MSVVSIIGAGPSGLIAAERLANSGHAVTIYDRMPSPARKFLLAGRGGLNITYSEPAERFATRYGARAHVLAGALAAFPPGALVAWCEGLGQAVFTGSSGRMFPVGLKAAPLLRAWLRRLDGLGVRLHVRHRWLGWDAAGALQFATPDGGVSVRPDATLLALGGASWPRMGSDGAWVDVLRARGVAVTALRASNCGVLIGWSEVFAGRFEGVPLKRVAMSAGGQNVRGEAVVTRAGLEGGVVYALSAPIRAALDAEGAATVYLDLRPDIGMDELSARVDGARKGRSLANFLRQSVSLPPVAVGLVQEALRSGASHSRLSVLIKQMPLVVGGMQTIDRAISCAGGVSFDEVDSNLMLRKWPGVFVAGEMLDWEAPTGGYLLQGCFTTGVVAGRGMDRWLRS